MPSPGHSGGSANRPALSLLGGTTRGTAELSSTPVHLHLRIARATAGGTVILALEGELDLATSHTLGQELEEAESLAPERLVIDLGAVEFIDSTGLQVLLQGHRRAERTGCALRVRNVPAQAKRLLDVTGVADFLLAD